MERVTAPFQYAMTTRAGTECVAHALQALTEADPTAIVMSLDGVSAFDLTSRRASFQLFVRVDSKPANDSSRFWMTYGLSLLQTGLGPFALQSVRLCVNIPASKCTWAKPRFGIHEQCAQLHATCWRGLLENNPDNREVRVWRGGGTESSWEGSHCCPTSNCSCIAGQANFQLRLVRPGNVAMFADNFEHSGGVHCLDKGHHIFAPPAPASVHGGPVGLTLCP